MKLEHRSEPLLPRRRFVMRMVRSVLLTMAVIGAALSIGAFGYHEFENLPWIDAFLNAAMILSGMGPVNALQTEPGKLFATFYALFSGLAFVSVTAILLGPIAHRCLHRFHLEDTEDDDARMRKANSE